MKQIVWVGESVVLALQTMLKLAAGSLSETAFADWIRGNIKSIESD